MEQLTKGCTRSLTIMPGEPLRFMAENLIGEYMNIQHEFEYWLRHEICWKLNLSKSKQVSMDLKFYGFANFVETLSRKAPEEFRQFCSVLKSNIDEVHKWKCPSDQCISPVLTLDEEGNVKFGKYPNGKNIYKLYPKT